MGIRTIAGLGDSSIVSGLKEREGELIFEVWELSAFGCSSSNVQTVKEQGVGGQSGPGGSADEPLLSHTSAPFLDLN